MRIVILGCGFGGVYTIQSLLSHRHLSRRHSIVLISRNPSFEFKPLFTEVLGGRLQPESARFSLHDILGKSPCKIKTATVTGIDVKKQIVKTDGGNVCFDYLVVSLGGGRDSIPLPKGVSLYSVESLDECVRLRDHISELASRAGNSSAKKGRTRKAIAVIGAGPTGVEVAAEIRHVLGTVQAGPQAKATQTPFDIHLIESADTILPDWGGSLRARAETFLRQSGIKLMTGTQIVRVAKGRIYLKGRKSIATDTVVWCGGLRGLPIYESIGALLDEKSRLRVNSSLQMLRHPNIYAMGDAINTEVFKTPVPRSGQAAYQQASVIAGNILASDSEKPLKRFKYVDLGEIIPVGGRYALARILCVPLRGMPAWMLEKAIFIMRIPGLANKARVLNGLAIDPLVEKGEEYLEKW